MAILSDLNADLRNRLTPQQRTQLNWTSYFSIKNNTTRFVLANCTTATFPPRGHSTSRPRTYPGCPLSADSAPELFPAGYRLKGRAASLLPWSWQGHAARPSLLPFRSQVCLCQRLQAKNKEKVERSSATKVSLEAEAPEKQTAKRQSPLSRFQCKIHEARCRPPRIYEHADRPWAFSILQETCLLPVG